MQYHSDRMINVMKHRMIFQEAADNYTEYGVNSKKIHMIYNGIMAHHFASNIRFVAHLLIPACKACYLPADIPWLKLKNDGTALC